MNVAWRYFARCAHVATSCGDDRNFMLGAVGIRTDGATVESPNIMTAVPTPSAHAEARVVKKLNLGSTVYVARVVKSGDFAMARPCPTCMLALVHRGVKRVFYTIGPGEYGVIDL